MAEKSNQSLKPHSNKARIALLFEPLHSQQHTQQRSCRITPTKEARLALLLGLLHSQQHTQAAMHRYCTHTLEQ
eukprot:1158949-Pelagomonas_calceolata.AAC.5